MSTGKDWPGDQTSPDRRGWNAVVVWGVTIFLLALVVSGFASCEQQPARVHVPSTVGHVGRAVVCAGAVVGATVGDVLHHQAPASRACQPIPTRAG